MIEKSRNNAKVVVARFFCFHHEENEEACFHSFDDHDTILKLALPVR